jgi:hypothetical protein
MINLIGDLWSKEADAICITTNGFVKKDGKAVMGKGCAREALNKYPNIDKTLGVNLKKYGNRPSLLIDSVLDGEPCDIWSFPVKPQGIFFDGSNVVKHMKDKFDIGDFVPGWACKADVELIKESAHQMMELADKFEYKKIVLPRPGCGAGELKWEEVEKVLEEILDDRFYVTTFSN